MEILTFIGLILLAHLATIPFAIAAFIGTFYWLFDTPRRNLSRDHRIAGFLASIGQCYWYWAFLGYFIDWIHVATIGGGWTSYVYWILGFAAVAASLMMCHTGVEAKSRAKGNLEGEAIIFGCVFTIIFTAIAFFVFAFNEGLWKNLYWWAF